jgi:hypothetical protein
MPADWKAIEDALRAWVLTTSGYADQRVLFGYQNDNAPQDDYITITLGGLLQLGQDCLISSTDLLRPPGQEIKLQVSGDREFSVTVEAFTTAVTGQATARALMSRVQTALKLSSIRGALLLAGISPFDHGDVQWLPAVYRTTFEGRAILTIRCYIRDDVAEFAGYIDKVEILDTGTGDVIEIP